MPRKLPWLNQNTKSTAKVDSARKSAKRPRIQTSDPNEESPSSSASAPRKEKRRVDWLPSSSPIPAPDLSPPSPEFMKDGVDADDAWVMVEDEFLETANLFTQHLHRAEYQRLKQLVGSQNESVTRKITRPVVLNAKVARETAKRMEADAKSKAQRKAIQTITDGEEDTPWIQDPRLAGLMNRPQVSSVLLASRTGAKANTRAAAGFAKAHPSSPRILREKFMSNSSKSQPTGLAGLAQEIERPDPSDIGDDDLDGPSQFRTSLKKLKKTHQPRERPLESTHTSRREPHRERLYDPALTSKRIIDPHTSPAEASSSSLASKSMASRPSRNSAMDLLDFDFPKRKGLSSEYEERLAKRKAERAKKEREEKQKSILLEEIPTFLV